jgi:CheY-like chemotaxis protein
MLKHILVVDDSKEAADSKMLIVQGLGAGEFSCEALYGGQECLARLDKQPPVDLIVLDLEMPEVNGVDIIRAILRMNPRPRLKILIASARAENWVSDWNATDLQDNAAYAQIVAPEIYGKSNARPQIFMSLVRKALGGKDAS